MSGLDDLIGSLQKAQTGGHGGGGLDDILGSVLGGGGGERRQLERRWPW